MLMAEGILSSSLTLHIAGISFLTAVSSGAADYSDSTLGQREAAAAFIVVRSAAAYCVVVIVVVVTSPSLTTPSPAANSSSQTTISSQVQIPPRPKSNRLAQFVWLVTAPIDNTLTIYTTRMIVLHIPCKRTS
eukprot:scaffold81615_cov46-Cyclotella_meneghiniana.AAC.1